MSREKKAQTIDRLHEAFSKCNIGILTNYRGLSTPGMTLLRRKLRELGIEYRVVKNTLARFAAEKAGRDDLVSFFEGPVAIAFGYGDITEPAKALAEYMSTSKASLSISGGFLGDKLLTAEDVEAISRLPSREILIGKVLSGMQSPITVLVNCLTTPIRGIIGGLQARINQLEGK